MTTDLKTPPATIPVVPQVVPVPMQEINAMAAGMRGSMQCNVMGLKKECDIVAALLFAQGSGMHPAMVLTQFDFIDGRPAMKAQVMQARFQAAGGSITYLETNERICSAEFTHPAGSGIFTWTIERAATAGYMEKKNWKQHPAAMLRARTISEGVRAILPGVTYGLYTPEEMLDFDPVPGQQNGPVTTPEHNHYEVPQDGNTIEADWTETENPAPPGDHLEEPEEYSLAWCKLKVAHIKTIPHLENWWNQHKQYFYDTLSYTEVEQLKEFCGDKKQAIRRDLNRGGMQ